MNNRLKSNAPPRPEQRRRTPTRRSAPPTAPRRAAPAVDDEIAAAVEAQLAKQREELTAKLLAERQEKRRLEAEERARASKKRAPKALLDTTKIIREEARRAAREAVKRELMSEPNSREAAMNNYEKTEIVQQDLLALLDLLGVVTTQDVVEHVRRPDGSKMPPNIAHRHMDKLHRQSKGRIGKVSQMYETPGLGWRPRDVWSKDPQKLLEIIEGKKIVRS